MTDTKATFEKLVRNGTKQDFVDHHAREFSFDTVFHITPYSYCCCPCAYEHEYFDYLPGNRINEEMFERIQQNIDRGRCPHVDNNDAHWRCIKSTGR